MLTDAAVDKLRERLGVQYNQNRAVHNMEVTWDGSRHFANGYGDDNPLFCNPVYGQRTRWGGLVAPPTFHYTMGEPDSVPRSPEISALLKGDPLAGLGSYQAVMEFEWWRPLMIGDRIRRRCALIGVVPRDKSEFSGRSVAEVQAFIYRNQDDELVHIRRGTWIRAERHASKEKKKKYELPEPYSDEQLAKIDAAYDAETIRGAEMRYFEDVEIGNELGTIVRGPLRTSDLIAWHMGWGLQLTPPGGFKISYQIRKKAGGMFTRNALNIPDTVQRLHWEKEWANELGVPLSYDYGAMRETFLANLITNWMGDDGWLWKMSCEHRKFVYTGDTYWISGEVVEKKRTDVGAEVHLKMRVENQWGTMVSPADAIVLLPTREKPVELPRPAEEDIDKMIEHEVERYRALDTGVTFDS
ncbi:MaoC family dehydratase N-terminal domain-containing protein [Sphingobium sp. SCG-1]|uniref:FAS1-like dehydratase domain-containing protein n=1 Tax=Sphingobium sp. SCG-1 TaxID=2072936 RepID=UPI001CB8BCAE|nr:MaoC family dehydratase N-terminal domain-containing protein [Sphingobium sp. SCG-1]